MLSMGDSRSIPRDSSHLGRQTRQQGAPVGERAGLLLLAGRLGGRLGLLAARAAAQSGAVVESTMSFEKGSLQKHDDFAYASPQTTSSSTIADEAAELTAKMNALVNAELEQTEDIDSERIVAIRQCINDGGAAVSPGIFTKL